MSITLSSDFWFEDGSIVVVVDNVAFRIHQSLLSHHSNVFAGLFTVPQPPNHDNNEGNDMMDDCPMVHLSDMLAYFTDVLEFCTNLCESPFQRYEDKSEQ